jgi:hypothetical protein
MRKNVRFYIRISSELLERLNREAEEQDTPISELCRQKLGMESPLKRIESLLLKMDRKLE